MLLRKSAIKRYITFPSHLTRAPALPRETGNPEIAYFDLNDAGFYQKHTKHIFKNIIWSQLNHPPLSKLSTVGIRQPRKGA